jgi:sigma-B regulation protein RsbU (phosphoserine phosphatase)
MRAAKKSTAPAADLGFGVSVRSPDAARATAMAREIELALSDWLAISVGEGLTTAAPRAGDASGIPQMIFIDATHGQASRFERDLTEVDRSRDGAYLIVEEVSELPESWMDGRADDVLIYPFRPLEVLSKLRHFQGLLEWREVTRVNAAYAELAGGLKENLELAAKLQKAKLPTRFPEVRGVKVTSRYMAGSRSGGNYVDMAESRDGNHVAIVLTDATSYKLSSAVVEAVPRVMSGLSLDEVRSSLTTARRLRDGVLATLSDKDKLSVFYGCFSRKDYQLRYVALGDVVGFYASPGKPFQKLEHHGDAILRAQNVRADKEGQVGLEPEGRLAIFSEGFVKVAGGAQGMLAILNRFRATDAKDTINELVFRVKSALADPEDLPAQDCTAAIFDVDGRVLRLA